VVKHVIGNDESVGSIPTDGSSIEEPRALRREVLLILSGRRESNSRLLLGRQRHYHYATPALVGRAGFEPAYRFREPNLQSGAFNHSTTYPRVGRHSLGPRASGSSVSREPTAGFEPAVGSLQNCCFGHLSYVGTASNCNRAGRRHATVVRINERGAARATPRSNHHRCGRTFRAVRSPRGSSRSCA